MVTLKPAEKAKDAPVEPGPTPGDAPHWFSYPPCAGVTYYSFEARPARSEKIESRSPHNTTTDIA